MSAEPLPKREVEHQVETSFRRVGRCIFPNEVRMFPLDEQVDSEPFWQGEGTDLELHPRLGRIIDWTEASVVHFKNRPLAHEDLAKVLYAEEWDSIAKTSVLTNRA